MKKLFTIVVLSIAALANAQNLVNDAGNITIAPGATIVVPGSFSNTNTGSVNNGGVMAVAGNFTAIANSIQFGNGTYRFNGTSPQTLSLNTNQITSVEVDNDSNLYLNSNVDGVNKLNFVNGKIISNGNNFTMYVAGNAVTGADSTQYFVCNNGGRFEYFALNAVDTAFYPIGHSENSYNPMWLKNSGSLDNFSVRVFDDVLVQGTSGISNTADQHLVNRTWDVQESNAGGTIPYIKLQWNAAHQRPLFNTQGNVGISYYIPNTATWSAISGVLATGNNPYTVAQGFSPNPQTFTTAYIVADENSAVTVNETVFSNLAIYPNPATAGNAIQVNALAIANKEVTLALYNGAGQMVFSEKKNVPANGFINTNLPNISSGLYLLTVSDGANALHKGKLVVR